jgi:glycosyltransferase involved in cell wall biosynthesis
LEPRKNFKGVINAYIQLKSKNRIKERLIIVGKKGWNSDGLFDIPENVRKCIIFAGYVKENILIKLYQNARLLVYPSFYEGFGLPVLEAMASGCPVVTSNVSSLPEISANAAILVNPHDSGQIADAMMKVLSDQSLSKDLANRGLMRTKKLTWKNCALQTLNVYEKVTTG